MKNTKSNKAKFFAHYWGQKVEKWNQSLQTVNVNSMPEYALSYSWLELKPLSKISDEDALSLVKMNYPSTTEVREQILIKWGKDLVDDIEGNSEDKEFQIFFRETFQCIDFLRSKGYALPFNGVSVEKQVEYGWIKLQE